MWENQGFKNGLSLLYMVHNKIEMGRFYCEKGAKDN